MKRINTIEDCRKLAKSRGGKCLESYYVNNKDNMLWQCSEGHIWPAAFGNIKKGSWCKICHRNNRRNGIEKCISLAKKYNGTFLGDTYTNNKEKYLWECENGHTFSARYNDIDQGHWCDICGFNNARKLMEEKYGFPYPLQNKEIKTKQEKTLMKNYGVIYPLQNQELALKSARNLNDSSTLYHWQTDEELVCQASWEPKVVQYLNKNRIPFRWQPRTFIMPDGNTYRPDLYLPLPDKWIEIKGYMRPDAEPKWLWFHKEYPNSELWDKDFLKSLNIL